MANKINNNELKAIGFHEMDLLKEAGDWRHNLMFAQELGIPYMMLHAGSLSFEHPFTGEKVRIQAPLLPHWQVLAGHCGWEEVLRLWSAEPALSRS